MSDDYETHELEMAFNAGAASRDAEVAELQNKLGQRFSDYNTFEQMRASEFRLGRQSRDAEIAELKAEVIRLDNGWNFANTSKLCADLEIDQLRDQVKLLRDALEYYAECGVDERVAKDARAATDTTSTPTDI